MLGHYRRVLMIGAHPDDEDTELLTLLVRGLGAEAAYLSLNRGEGGQNLIGPELGEALGLIRSEELLAARRLDGARQYFTRAYDFGYSKTLAETWSHWPQDTILKDVVRIVRRFRPQVIVSVFSGTPRDGHGQHQAAGWSAAEAFQAAGDSTRFPELEREEGLRAWTPLKLYRSARFDSAATTLRLAGGVLDPAVGKSYHQIAMAGRSLHRSQDMGQLQRLGPSEIRLALVEDRTGQGGGGLFDGIDTTMTAMPWRSRPEETEEARVRFAALVDSARGLVGPASPGAAAGMLGRARRELEPRQPDARVQVLFWTPEQTDQRRHLDRAIAIAQGLVGDAVAEDDRVVGGQRVAVTTAVWNAGADSLAAAAHLHAPPGWSVEGDTLEPVPLAPGDLQRQELTVVVPEEGSPEPYFLRHPLLGGLYDWTGTSPRARGEPFDPDPSPELLLSSAAGGRMQREVTYRLSDQALGEMRRPLTVVPRVDVKLDPDTTLWSTVVPASHRFTVTLTHGARDTTAGTVRLVLPEGWAPVASRRFRFTGEDQHQTFAFEVRPPRALGAGTVEVRAVARTAGGEEFSAGVYTVDYPHIRPRSYALPAVATVRTAALALPPLARVGYVRGASDRVPEALRRAGLPVELLDPATLDRGDLARYDAIVVGPRAYETEPALVENNGRLLDYARAGGLVIVQYQQHRFFTGDFAPYPLAVGGRPLTLVADSPAAGSAGAPAPPPAPPVSHDRVTDETAPVAVVAADHPALLRPNRIGAEDWEGWVQERGLYFARTWDAAYQPLLETHDPDEAPLEGGLLVAAVGKGTYVYTGLSFFRQLPAGVPGAFRLFANLLALRAPRAR